MDDVPADDPYAPRPTLWQRHPQLAWILAVFGVTVGLTVMAYPPVNQGEAAYVLALPAALWIHRRPAFQLFAWTVLGSHAVAWTVLLWWLHNVTWVGLFILGPFAGLLASVWLLGAWWVIPRVRGHHAIIRIVAMLGLAGLCVVLEWVRGWLFGGFPWLPLAASQWQHPFLLQVAAYAGAWATTFILIVFNLGAAAYVHRAFFEGVTGFKKRTPEFSVALLVLMAGSFPFLGETFNQERRTLVRAALIQPYIPQDQKWDEAFATTVLKTLEAVTLTATKHGSPELIIWPEAVTPWPLFRDKNVQSWLEYVTNKAGKPILLGTVYTRPGSKGEEDWYNGAFLVEPKTGLRPEGYAKRKLVPFGEYIPLRPVLGWLEKFVPIGGDFIPGKSAAPVPVPTVDGPVPVGVLVCYEDIFPHLARASAQEGAELLAVLTNNAWYGEGGAAYQHAAHSVLRAIENRRPVVRVGNGGWSGWIDEYGNIRVTVLNDAGTVYFRGGQTVTVSRDRRWEQRQSFYTQHGDWFVAVCAVLATVTYYLVLTLRPLAPKPDGETAY
ncbi:MAG TPA: apolipoprotein N-acyltransferase [Lacunisphaera sp.]|nr:apolipoprotein N-acyltransferase [Lacunisphaera sp.]